MVISEDWIIRMLPLYLIIASMIPTLIESAPSPSTSRTQLIGNKNSRHETSTKKNSQRLTRSFGELNLDIEIWTGSPLAFVYPMPSVLSFDFNKNGHVTPDFSNGLDYPDPLLITGVAAKKAVTYLYSKELFFSDIPHVRAILQNQEQRRINGLPNNRLGSIRDNSPFTRYKKRFQQFL